MAPLDTSLLGMFFAQDPEARSMYSRSFYKLRRQLAALPRWRDWNRHTVRRLTTPSDPITWQDVRRLHSSTFRKDAGP